MATSDSEDFESADEDFLDDSLKKPDKTKSSDLDVQHSHQSVKDTLVDKEAADPKKGETGAGDLLLLGPLSKNEETEFVMSQTESDRGKEGIELNKAKEPCTGEVHIERKRRQQKQREHKINSMPKKLGTKITSNTRPIHKVSLDRGQEDESVHSTAPTPSPRPTSHETDVDSENFTCQQELGPDVNVCPSDIDPYEKFKGYSMPPKIQQCWEEGVDNNALYGIGSELYCKETTNENRVAPVLDELSEAESTADKVASPSSTWGGWGSWGVTSLLSSATESVSTLTSHVSSVLESGIGAPNPEELARMNQLEQQKFSTEIADSKPIELIGTPEESTGLFNFGHLITSMSSISKLVETTGSKVLSGGLDTLETIGKKTMEVLQDGDPGLKKKRAMFSDTTVLSQILREAKEKAELEDKVAKDKQAVITNVVHFETLFDDYQGLVHLEALEMLSKQCDLKLQSLLLSSSGPALSQLQGKLQEVKDSCQLPDDEDISEEENKPGDWWKKLATAEKTLGVPFATDKLATVWSETQEWLKESTGTEGEIDNKTSSSASEIHKKAVSTLAQLTATSVEQFHKGAELLLVKESHNPPEEVEAFKLITSVLCSQVSTAATDFCESLNNCTEESNSDSVNSLITNIFFEASNSSSYIQEAFQLLIPILQVGLTT